MPIALAVNAVNAALTAIVLQRLAGVILPFGWLCAVVLVTAGRLVLWLRYRRASPSEKEDPHWPLLATGTEKSEPPQNPMSADRVRWEHIQRIYEMCNRNVSETARRLNMHRRTLQRILAKRAPR